MDSLEPAAFAVLCRVLAFPFSCLGNAWILAGHALKGLGFIPSGELRVVTRQTATEMLFNTF